MRLFVVFVALIFASVFAEASGKLSLQNNVYKDGRYRPMVGFGIYEPMFAGKVAINSWTGYGNQPFELSPDVNWFTTKNQIDVHLSKLTLSPGFQYSFVWPFEEERSWLYLKIDYKLW